ncbi:MAG TPA: DUF2970 domain-containing protein [Oceanospirillaceae bacterium]|nr:DUF2970 domain-containing protein [Oceanospirillaceae bacterium]
MSNKDNGPWWRHWLSFMQSVLAALVGVQSRDKQEKDFNEGGLERMLAIAFVTCLLVLGLVLIMVNIALPD